MKNIPLKDLKNILGCISNVTSSPINYEKNGECTNAQLITLIDNKGIIKESFIFENGVKLKDKIDYKHGYCCCVDETCEETEVNIENTEGTVISQEIVINCEENTIVIPDINITIVDDVTQDVISNHTAVVGENKTIPVTIPRILDLGFNVLEGTDSTVTITLTENGTITVFDFKTLTNVEIIFNGVPLVGIPLFLDIQNGDTISFTFDTATTDLEIKLIGTYI